MKKVKKFFLWTAIVAGAVMIWFFLPPYTRPWTLQADWWRVLGIIAGVFFLIVGGIWLVLLGWEKHTEKHNEKHGW